MAVLSADPVIINLPFGENAIDLIWSVCFFNSFIKLPELTFQIIIDLSDETVTSSEPFGENAIPKI